MDQVPSPEKRLSKQGSSLLPAPPPSTSLASDDQLRTRLQQLLGTRHTDLRAMLLEPATTPVRFARLEPPW